MTQTSLTPAPNLQKKTFGHIFDSMSHLQWSPTYNRHSMMNNLKAFGSEFISLAANNYFMISRFLDVSKQKKNLNHNFAHDKLLEQFAYLI